MLHPCISEIASRRGRIEKALRAGKLTPKDSAYLNDNYVYLYKDGPTPTLALGRRGSANLDGGVDETNSGILFTVSTTDEDRDGDVVYSPGYQGDDYAKNPLWLFGHGDWAVPIGTSRHPKDPTHIAVYPDDNKVTQICFFDREDPDADFLYGKVKRGIINATSVAFVPIEAYRREIEKARTHDSPNAPPGWYFKRWSHTETSLVAVPSNAGAVRDILDKEKSFISPKCQKVLGAYASQPKGCFNGWCPRPTTSKRVTKSVTADTIRQMGSKFGGLISSIRPWKETGFQFVYQSLTRGGPKGKRPPDYIIEDWLKDQGAEYVGFSGMVVLVKSQSLQNVMTKSMSWLDLNNLVKLRASQAQKIKDDVANGKYPNKKERQQKLQSAENLLSAVQVAGRILGDRKLSDAQRENDIKSLFQTAMLDMKSINTYVSKLFSIRRATGFVEDEAWLPLTDYLQEEGGLTRLQADACIRELKGWSSVMNTEIAARIIGVHTRNANKKQHCCDSVAASCCGNCSKGKLCTKSIAKASKPTPKFSVGQDVVNIKDPTDGGKVKSRWFEDNEWWYDYGTGASPESWLKVGKVKKSQSMGVIDMLDIENGYKPPINPPPTEQKKPLAGHTVPERYDPVANPIKVGDTVVAREPIFTYDGRALAKPGDKLTVFDKEGPLWVVGRGNDRGTAGTAKLRKGVKMTNRRKAVNHLGEQTFSNYAAWVRALKVKYPGVKIEGDKDIANALANGKGVGDWDGERGTIYNKSLAKAQPSSDIDPDKACKILQDGTVNGQPITDAQRGVFGAACARAKKSYGGLRETCKALTATSGTAGGYVVDTGKLQADGGSGERLSDTATQGYKPCDLCDGTGSCPNCDGVGNYKDKGDCKDCEGSGDCPKCDGTGYKVKSLAKSKNGANMPRFTQKADDIDDDDKDLDEDQEDKDSVDEPFNPGGGDDLEGDVDDVAMNVTKDEEDGEEIPADAPFVPKASAAAAGNLYRHYQEAMKYLDKALPEMDHPGMAEHLEEHKEQLGNTMEHIKEGIMKFHGEGEGDADAYMEKLCKALETDTGGTMGGSSPGEERMVDAGDVPPDTLEEGIDDDVDIDKSEDRDTVIEGGAPYNKDDGIDADEDTQEILERYRTPKAYLGKGSGVVNVPPKKVVEFRKRARGLGLKVTWVGDHGTGLAATQRWKMEGDDGDIQDLVQQYGAKQWVTRSLGYMSITTIKTLGHTVRVTKSGQYYLVRKGSDDPYYTNTCPGCNGFGKQDAQGYGDPHGTKTCPLCRGTGKKDPSKPAGRVKPGKSIRQKVGAGNWYTEKYNGKWYITNGVSSWWGDDEEGFKSEQEAVAAGKRKNPSMKIEMQNGTVKSIRKVGTGQAPGDAAILNGSGGSDELDEGETAAPYNKSFGLNAEDVSTVKGAEEMFDKMSDDDDVPKHYKPDMRKYSKGLYTVHKALLTDMGKFQYDGGSGGVLSDKGKLQRNDGSQGSVLSEEGKVQADQAAGKEHSEYIVGGGDSGKTADNALNAGAAPYNKSSKAFTAGGRVQVTDGPFKYEEGILQTVEGGTAIVNLSNGKTIKISTKYLKQKGKVADSVDKELEDRFNNVERLLFQNMGIRVNGSNS